MRHVVLAVAALASSPALAVDVLVIHGTTNSPMYHQEVQAYLVASGLFTAVDVWAGDVSIPTPADLVQYDAVLLMPDSGWADPNIMGDRLAAYVDNSGGVVETVFSPTQHTRGRFSRSGYSPILYTNAYGNPNALGAVQPGSPLLNGVGSFTDPRYHDDSARVAPGADRIAAYANGSALEAAWVPSGAGSVVSLNMYPPSNVHGPDFWDVNTDGARLVANALLGAANGGFSATFNTQAAGACPGPAQVWAHNATAGGPLAIVSGTAGASTIPAGRCAGTRLPIANPRVRAQGVADAVGVFSLFIPSVQAGACGARFVAVDLTTCAVAAATLP